MEEFDSQSQLNQRNTTDSHELALILKELHSWLKKDKWTDENIREKLWRRTIAEIKSSWETCFMWSCVDTTLLSIMKLKELGFDMKKVSLWCELLIWKNTWMPAAHFFIKDESVEPWRIIDFSREWILRIYPLPYKNPRDWRELQTQRIVYLNWSEIEETDSSYSLAEKIHLPITDEYFNQYLDKLIKDNTYENYSNYLSSRKPLKITIDGAPVNYQQVQKDSAYLLKEILDEKENEKILKLMNELRGIIGHLFWRPYGVIVWVERGLKSLEDKELEKYARVPYVNCVHDDLKGAYWAENAICVTYLKFKSWWEIAITNTREGQEWTWQSWEALNNYMERLEYSDPEICKKYFMLRAEAGSLWYWWRNNR